MTPAYIIDFQSIGMRDVHRVGGKNASLGEMIVHLSEAGVRVPGGFATTAEAYRDFLGQEDLEGRIRKRLAGLDVEDVRPRTALAPLELARKASLSSPVKELLLSYAAHWGAALPRQKQNGNRIKWQ